MSFEDLYVYITSSTEVSYQYLIKIIDLGQANFDLG